jgi:hypothetical protein
LIQAPTTVLVDAVADRDSRDRPFNTDTVPARLDVAIDVGHLRAQEAICLHANLMRGPVVHAEGPGVPANVDAKCEPRERLLEDPLAQIAREEESVWSIRTERCEEAQMRDPHVLRLIYYGEVKRAVRAFG